MIALTLLMARRLCDCIRGVAVQVQTPNSLIEDNRIVGASESPLMLANVEDALVRNNVFVGPCGVKLDVCRDVKFVGNARDGRPFATAETVMTQYCTRIC